MHGEHAELRQAMRPTALVENVLRAKEVLPVPLALENISTLFDWPDAEMDEADFVIEALERTDCLMLLDIANVWANGVYHDTHAHAVPAGVIDLLGELCAIARPPGVMLERDDDFPPDEQLMSELDAIAGAARLGGTHVH